MRTPSPEVRRLTLPFSEVCMHMGVAGKAMNATRVSQWMVQLLGDDGSLFSAPITTGEAGWGMALCDPTVPVQYMTTGGSR